MFSPALDMSLRTSLSSAALWLAVTEARHLRDWWPEVALDPHEGGRIEAREVPYKKKQTRVAKGRIEEIDDWSYVRFSWRTDGRATTTHVDIHVSQSKKKSKLRVVETGFQHDGYAAIEVERMRDFWRDRFDALRRYVDHDGTAKRLEREAKHARD